MNDSTRPRGPEEERPGARNEGDVLEELVPEDDTIIGHAFRWSVGVLLVAGLLVAGVVWWRGRETDTGPVEESAPELARPQERPAAGPPALPFTDVTAAAGIDFQHESGARGEKLLPETMGGGCAFLDFDGDGDPDLLLVGCTWWPDDPRWAQGSPPSSVALYRNDGAGRLTDVTAETGLELHAYTMGCAVGDVDGDRDLDLFLTAVGPDRLYRNDAGHFVEVTDTAGVAGGSDQWSSSASFFDADGDGDLDLFVARYVQWNRELDLELGFQLTGVGRAYGPPTNFPGQHSTLYRNAGEGRFTDVSEEAGLHVSNPATGVPVGKALAVMPFDFDEDGHIDVFVANDTVQNFLFRNLGDGRFEEIGTRSGMAYDSNGAATGAMGVDVAYHRNDEALSVAVANFANEMTSFYVSGRDRRLYTDEAIVEGIGPGSREALSFGLLFVDLDLDGYQDLLQVNGHLEEEINKVQPSQHYRQSAQLFWNAGPAARACFTPVSDDRLGDLTRPIVGRGASAADLDGDGDLDLCLMQVGGPPLLLRNDQSTSHHWLRVRLEGRAPNTGAIGAQVALRTGDRWQRRLVMPTRSYLSQVELPVTFGLGDTDRIAELRIIWPDGTQQTLTDVPADQELVVRQE